MSLLVHRCEIIDGELDPIDWEGSEEMAGFEVTRQKLWGSEALIALGAQILPELGDSDLYCYPDQLDQLEIDTRLVLGHIDELSLASGYDAEYIVSRATNILNAVQWARENAGGVIIW
jgi:hypothetical protein